MPTPIIPYKPEELQLLANLLTGEAGGEGVEGMQNAGDVMINRVIAGRDQNASKNCTDFKDVHSITEMVYQIQPGSKRHSFNAVDEPTFYGPPNPDAMEIAQQLVDGLSVMPGKYALWFMRPPGKDCPKFYGVLAGRFKNHCFYNPPEGMCPAVLHR